MIWSSSKRTGVPAASSATRSASGRLPTKLPSGHSSRLATVTAGLPGGTCPRGRLGGDRRIEDGTLSILPDLAD